MSGGPTFLNHQQYGLLWAGMVCMIFFHFDESIFLKNPWKAILSVDLFQAKKQLPPTKKKKHPQNSEEVLFHFPSLSYFSLAHLRWSPYSLNAPLSWSWDFTCKPLKVKPLAGDLSFAKFHMEAPETQKQVNTGSLCSDMTQVAGVGEWRVNRYYSRQDPFSI